MPYSPNYQGKEQLLGIVGSAYLHYKKDCSAQSISSPFGLWKSHVECCWNNLRTVQVPWMRWAVLSMCCRAVFDSDKYCIFTFPFIRQTCLGLLFWKSICIFFHSFNISIYIHIRIYISCIFIFNISIYSCFAASEFQSAVRFHDFPRTA